MCATTASDINCTNSGTADGFASQTTGGGNAAVTNSGNNIANGMLAQTVNGGNATATNTGSDTGNVNAVTFVNGNATVTNSGSIMGGIQARTLSGGNAAATNSGSVTGGVAAVTLGGGTATATNSGSNANGTAAITMAGGDATATSSGTTNGLAAITAGGGNATATSSGINSGGTAAVTTAGGNASATNSGSNTSGILAETLGASGNATAINSGSNTGGIVALAVFGNATVNNSRSNTGGAEAISIFGNAIAINSGSNSDGLVAQSTTGNATVINSGVARSSAPFEAIDVEAGATGNATLTNVVGARVIGGIFMSGATDTVNFVGGNWLLSIELGSGNLAINTGGAPFVVVPTATGSQVAVLDPTAFALADRALVNFTGGVSQILQDRFNGMAASAGGPVALGFAALTNSGAADTAQAAFAGIPTLATSYASDSRPLIGKAAAAAPAHYDTTVWASGFGGERRQHADGSILPATDTAYGGAMGVDRIVS